MTATNNQKDNIELSIIIPCYNEENALAESVARVLELAQHIKIEIIIVDDCSTDNSLEIIQNLAKENREVSSLAHQYNQGKGAALRTGFIQARGRYVAVHDADLEYNPMELLDLLEPLRKGKADVVFGSRYYPQKQRRILYFWHSLMNRALTMCSNAFTDLDLTDMETCYKVFKREIIQSIEIEENRFGFEPEIVAKVAQMRVPVYEIGISYNPRTYSEGKKINWRDGLRALYCIFHYNAHKAPIPIQFLIYFFIGATAALCNLIIFKTSLLLTTSITFSAIIAYILAAAINYWLCIKILFRHRARWDTKTELLIYLAVVFLSGIVDVGTTRILSSIGHTPTVAKIWACLLSFLFNFIGRRFFVFPEPPMPKL